MSLPKLNTPVYEAILPSTDKVIKFRPFLVKEEKVLLTAMEDGSQTALMNAIKTILKNCVQGNLDVERLPLFDIEYLFLKLRSKSIGEISEIGLKCTDMECGGVNQLSINMDEIEVTKPKGHNRKIMISDDVGVMMSYPVMKTSGITEEDGMAIVKDCIEMIFTEEETHERDSFTSKELDEFIDSMDTKQFAKIKEFFDTMPKLQHTINYKCEKCGEDKEVTLQGLDSFFG
tara:strand:- start:289 stop:981 length:693 start_codon:yes stop_codon:yes gene_type:complete